MVVGRKLLLGLLLLVGAMKMCLCNHITPQKMIVGKPIVDMRLAPSIPNEKKQAPLLFEDDPLQSSQLLYNEHVMALQEEGEWLKVLALEQSPPARNGYREGCIGWVSKENLVHVEKFPASNVVIKCGWATIYDLPDQTSNGLLRLSLGTKLWGEKRDDGWWTVRLVDGSMGCVLDDQVCNVTATVEDEDNLRAAIVQAAQRFLVTPYCWGGRSSYRAGNSLQRAGVDCSSLVELAYRSVGLQIPRMSHFQYLHSQQISPQSLRPGDLIFFAKLENPQLIVHVMMYSGDGMLLEATGWGIAYPFLSQEISVTDKVGKPLELLRQGEMVGRYIVYFGSYLANKTLTQTLRDTFLTNEYKDYFSLPDGYRCFFRS